MTEHKATPEQWALVERYEASCFRPCILELRDRVEALEAAAKPAEEPDDSLVERVADAIAGDKNGSTNWWKPEARAAILAVADWLDQQGLRIAIAATELRREVG